MQFWKPGWLAVYGRAGQEESENLPPVHNGEQVSALGIELRENQTDQDSLPPYPMLDDILESGRSLAYAQTLMRERGAKDVKVAVLLEKPGKRTVVDVKADFVGFTVPDKFVFPKYSVYSPSPPSVRDSPNSQGSKAA